MKFIFVLTHVESAWDKAPAGEAQRVFDQYQAFERALASSGRLLESVRLRPSHEARTLRSTCGAKRSVVDGPWTDGEAVMGGYYKIECDSFAHALELAQSLPDYGHGSIEVRPVWE